MQLYFKRGLVISLALLLLGTVSCNQADKGDLASKKAKLQKLRTQQNDLADQIKTLEDEIARLDPASAAKPKLVDITTIESAPFSHYIDLQGKVTTNDIYMVTPRGQGGQVKAIYIKEGDRVKKGQVLLKLEDAIIRQQIDQAKVQLAYAQDIYQRRKNLWDQNIGTEVELITARNNVTNLQKQIDLLNEQLSFTTVTSDVSGVVETVGIRVGEFFNGSPQAGIVIVNPASLKVSVDIPENYLDQVKKGALVNIEVPDLNKTFQSRISLVSQLINNNSRGFTAEARIPADPNLKPNQLAIMHIQDYSAPQAIVVPLTTLQTDSKGKFVFVMATENGKKIARKRSLEVGQIYGEKIEVKNGLQAGDQLVSQGYQSLYDGELITTEMK